MFTVHKKQKTTKIWKIFFFLSANQRWVVFDPIGLKGLRVSINTQATNTCTVCHSSTNRAQRRTGISKLLSPMALIYQPNHSAQSKLAARSSDILACSECMHIHSTLAWVFKGELVHHKLGTLRSLETWGRDDLELVEHLFLKGL